MIVIAGAGRNGSTILARQINNFSRIYIHPVEERFTSKWCDLVNFGYERRATKLNYRVLPIDQLSLSKKLHVKVLLNAYEESLIQHSDILNISPSTSIDHYQKHLQEDYYSLDDFIKSYIFASFKLENGKLTDFGEIGFKTIETPYLNTYRDLNYNLVHIFRDPLDVCESQKRSMLVKKKKHEGYLGGDWLSTTVYRRLLPHLQSKISDTEIIVYYEDFIQNPMQIKTELEQKFGLSQLDFDKSPKLRDAYFNITNSSSDIVLPDGIRELKLLKSDSPCLHSGETNYIISKINNNSPFFWERLNILFESFRFRSYRPIVKNIKTMIVRTFREIKGK